VLSATTGTSKTEGGKMVYESRPTIESSQPKAQIISVKPFAKLTTRVAGTVTTTSSPLSSTIVTVFGGSEVGVGASEGVGLSEAVGVGVEVGAGLELGVSVGVGDAEGDSEAVGVDVGLGLEVGVEEGGGVGGVVGEREGEGDGEAE
jgi:hypothetical protein